MADDYPWYGKFRVAFGTGLTIPPTMNLGPMLGIENSSFTLRPGYNINAFADYTVWKGFNLGLSYRYSNFYSPDPGADEFKINSLSIYSGWSFNFDNGSFDAEVEAGISYITITDVQNTLFAIVQGAGKDFSYYTPFVGIDLRLTGKVFRYLDVYAQVEGILSITQDAVIPLLSINAGIMFRSGSLFDKYSEIETQAPIIEQSYINSFTLQLFFYPNSTNVVEESYSSIKKQLENYAIIYPHENICIELVGYAVPVGDAESIESIIDGRIEYVKDLLLNSGFSESIFENTECKAGEISEVEEENWHFLRRVDITLSIES